VISSLTNAHVRRIRALRANREERYGERCFVLEGVRLVATACATNVPLRLVLFAPEQLDHHPLGQQLLGQLVGQTHCYAATARVVAAAADTPNPQGIVAVAAIPEVSPKPGLTLILDALQDPGNVGTLLRSAEAAGVGQVFCTPGTADIYSPKVVRSAMGAHFTLAMQPDLPWEAITTLLTKLQPSAIYAAVATSSLPYYDLNWLQNAVLIIGNETKGVSEAGLALATHQITIPMAGQAESLNAAVAGSILLFEMLRQKSCLVKAGPRNPQL